MPRENQSSGRRGLELHALAVLGFLLAVPLAALPTPPGCADCHGDLVAPFSTSAHGKAFEHDDHYAAASCASCHGPLEKHAESGEAADILNPSKQKGERADTACLSCHQNQRSHMLWEGGAHQTAGVRCIDCHAVHRAAPGERGVVRASSDVCLSCHAKQRVALTQRSHHPLGEGKLACASCHNPHGTATEKSIKADSVNDLCLSCHQEKRGPFLWEHAPVREDCMTCHQSHGSNNEALLVARTTQLCQSCHLQGRHQTVAGYSTAMWNTNRGCLNCHAQIHGSNHPSGPLFQR